jgi:hypothetical protein
VVSGFEKKPGEEYLASEDPFHQSIERPTCSNMALHRQHSFKHKIKNTNKPIILDKVKCFTAILSFIFIFVQYEKKGDRNKGRVFLILNPSRKKKWKIFENASKHNVKNNLFSN